jgi:hypothetical protein
MFDGQLMPYGARLIEEKMTDVISTMLDEIVPKIGDKEIVVCGEDPARRMVARKLEDRLKRPVKYD